MRYLGLQCSKFRLLSTWGFRSADVSHTACRFVRSKRVHSHTAALQKWQRCCQAHSPVNTYVFISAANKHFYVTIANGIQGTLV
jgi:hypothetical protein